MVPQGQASLGGRKGRNCDFMGRREQESERRRVTDRSSFAHLFGTDGHGELSGQENLNSSGQ